MAIVIILFSGLVSYNCDFISHFQLYDFYLSFENEAVVCPLS
jgi:hypothetical protein